ncbi:hypothetical protein L5515_003082 [Caenorhabditis briggsae]|uniref:Uncharacterized protein n=1 Tax=Caenorhabditis briggsae TaxID=6238 RepID=A0AAE9EI35_CAEBR|nr:hypothetical protein L5515_003082 [Caenorhabditis briggsae]
MSSSDGSDLEPGGVENVEDVKPINFVDEFHLNLTDSKIKLRYLTPKQLTAFESEAEFLHDNSDDNIIEDFWRDATRNLKQLQGIGKLTITVESDGCDDLDSYRWHGIRRFKVFEEFGNFLDSLLDTIHNLSVFDFFFTFETPEDVGQIMDRIDYSNICKIYLDYNERSLERKESHELNMISVIGTEAFQHADKLRAKNVIFPWDECRFFSNFNDAVVCFHGELHDHYLMDLIRDLLKNHELAKLQINCPSRTSFDQNVIDRLRSKYETDLNNWTYFSYERSGKLGMNLGYKMIVFRGPRYRGEKNGVHEYYDDMDVEEEIEGIVKNSEKLPDNIDMILADLYIEEQFPELFLKQNSYIGIQ